MTQDVKLTQMLLTTMVTNQNINYAIRAFSSNDDDGAAGTCSEEQQLAGITIGAIRGTLFGFLIIFTFSWLLAFWRQRNHETEHEIMDHHCDYATLESLSDDDDESQDTFIVSPTRYGLRRSLKENHELEIDSFGGYWVEEEDHHHNYHHLHHSPAKSSLRLALKKHQGLGLGWADSGERYSYRVAYKEFPYS